ncbi:hypothetical protein RB195_002725 [Necator americanus]|uniref:Uncharacterized protein n=1 Tax=Necator americanus TaxID=51031 RepID=A0ABR1DKD9_NECAM
MGITKMLYSNLLRLSTPPSTHIIFIVEVSPRILPSEVPVAIRRMKPDTAPRPDFISRMSTEILVRHLVGSFLDECKCCPKVKTYLLGEYGIHSSSRREMENVTKCFYFNLSRFSLVADQKRPCACPETQVDSGHGLPVSAEPGLTHDILVSRTSVRPKARNQVTGRCKGSGLESPPTNKLHMSTPGERKFSQKLMGLEACNLPIAESTKDDVHAERMDLGCPVHAQRKLEWDEMGATVDAESPSEMGLGCPIQVQWNEHVRMHQLCFFTSLFNTTVLLALTYASETWAFRKRKENAVSVIERAIEGVMLGVSRFTQVRDGIRSSLLRQRSKFRDAAAFVKESKIRWAGHVMRFNDNRWTRAESDWVPRDIMRTTGRPPTQWSNFFTKSFKEKYDALRVLHERRNHWATLARDRDKCKN